MKFDESYFEPSIVDDFYIRPMIKRSWAAQIEVLSEIDKICKRHNIQYFAEYGTLLGAIRHKGFIPWDDDLDIGMMREDYERFYEYAKEELPEGLHILSVRDQEDFDQLLTRVVNTMKVDMSPEFMEKYHGCPYCCGIDIFITDKLPNDPTQKEVMYQLMYAAGGLARYWKDAEEITDDMWDGLAELERASGQKIDRSKHIPNQLYNLCEAICMMYQDENAEEVAMAVNLSYDRVAYTIPAEYYASYIEVPFETTTIPVPVGYHEILVKRYGPNYMTPIKRWGTHDYPFFKSQEKLLVEFFRQQGEPVPQMYDVMPNPTGNAFWGVTHHRNLTKDSELASKNGLYELRIEDLADYQDRALPWRPHGLVVPAELFVQLGYRAVTDAAVALGAKYIVLETIGFGDIEGLENQLSDGADALRWTNLTIYIENGFDTDFAGRAIRNHFSDTGVIGEIISAFNMYIGRNCIQMCLNIGYANLLRMNIRAMVDALKDEIGLVHMNDNNGLENQKQMPFTFGNGRGDQTTDYSGILEALKRNQFLGGIVADVDGLWENCPETVQPQMLDLLQSIGRDWSIQIANARKE